MMRGFRFSVVFLMAVLAVAALDLTVFLSLFRWRPDSNAYLYVVPINGVLAIPFGTLALGVFPMASLLVLVAVHRLPEVRRTGALSGFWLRFEAAGWLSVFLYMAAGSIAPELLYAYLHGIERFVVIPFLKSLGNVSVVWVDVVLFATAFLVLVLPEILLATAGGWLARRAGVRTIEGRGADE